MKYILYRSLGDLDKAVKNLENLEFKASVIENTVYDAAGTKAIAGIPSREVLLSKLLGSLQSPITNFARVIKQIAEQGGASVEAEEAAAAPAEEDGRAPGRPGPSGGEWGRFSASSWRFSPF